MGKNNKLINSLKEVAARNREMNLYKASEDITPHVYAGIALALHRYHGWGYKRINQLFTECMKICEEDCRDSLIKMCEAETGIYVCKGLDEEDVC